MSEEVVLHLTTREQEAVVGWMIKNREFMLRCKTAIKPNYFTAHACISELFSMLCAFVDRFGRAPSPSEMEGEISAKFVTMTDFQERKRHLDFCVLATNQIGLDVLAVKMTDWIKLVHLKQLIVESTNIWNKKRYDVARDFIKMKMAELQEASFEQDEHVNYGDTVKFLEERAKGYEQCCTIGSADFDEILRKGSAIRNTNDWTNIKTTTKGGLIPGDMTVLVGPSNAGKTTSVVSIIKQNILMGKFVLFVTHEQKDEDLRFKLLQAMMDMDGDQLNTLRNSKDDPQKMSNLAEVEWKLRTFLLHVSWIKPGKMFVEDVVEEIQLRTEKFAASVISVPRGDSDPIIVKPPGQGFDLLVCDYPGLLKSRIFTGGKNSNSYDEKGYVYRQFLQLGRAYKYHVLVPAQTNREGFKISRGDSDRVLDQGDIADSFNISQGADNVITINRGPKDKEFSTTRYHVSKSRSGPTGWTYVTRVDFSKSSSIGPNLASCVFGPGDNATPEEIQARLGTWIRFSTEKKNPLLIDPAKDYPKMPDSKEKQSTKE